MCYGFSGISEVFLLFKLGVFLLFGENNVPYFLVPTFFLVAII